MLLTCLYESHKYSAFRKNLFDKLDEVNNDKDVTIMVRPNGKSVVLIDKEEYNNLMNKLQPTQTEIPEINPSL